MKDLILFSHPSKGSFNHQLLEEIKLFLKERNRDFKILDLYQIGFDPRILEEELPLEDRTTPGLNDEIRGYQKLLNESDRWIFIFPVYWFHLPAILKGFFDRVFREGFSFRYQGSRPIGCLKNKKVFVFCSFGSSYFVAEWWMGGIVKKYFREVLLKPNGIDSFSYLPVYSIRKLNGDLFQIYLKKVRNILGV